MRGLCTAWRSLYLSSRLRSYAASATFRVRGMSGSALSPVAESSHAGVRLSRCLSAPGSGRISPRCSRCPHGCFPIKAAASAGVPAPRVPRDRESTRRSPELSQFVILMIPLGSSSELARERVFVRLALARLIIVLAAVRLRPSPGCQWPSVSPRWRPLNSPLVAIVSPRWWPSDLPTCGHRFSPAGSWVAFRSGASPPCRRSLARAGSSLGRR